MSSITTIPDYNMTVAIDCMSKNNKKQMSQFMTKAIDEEIVRTAPIAKEALNHSVQKSIDASADGSRLAADAFILYYIPEAAPILVPVAHASITAAVPGVKKAAERSVEKAFDGSIEKVRDAVPQVVEKAVDCSFDLADRSFSVSKK